MDCKRTLALLPAHVDQELGLPEVKELDDHLQTCPACHSAFVSQTTLRAAIKQRATYFQAPIDLESRIRAALPKETDAQPRRAKQGPRDIPVKLWMAPPTKMDAKQLSEEGHYGVKLE